MRIGHHVMLGFSAVAFAWASLLPAAAAARPADAQSIDACDRACLTGLLTSYVDALAAGDPSKLPLAPRARFTEDSQDMKPGEGLWKSVTGKGGFRQDYIDLRKQVAAAHVEMREGKNPVLLSVVLHVEGGRIAGVETLVQRFTPNSRFQPKVLGSPIKGMNDPVPASGKQSRQSMIETALTYTEGLRVGNFTDADTPFAAETYRVENGVVTAGEGCGRADCGLYAQNIFVHPAILASVAAVDEEQGIVLLWMNFGDTGSYEPGNALITFEAFKVWGGKIHSINAFLTTRPQALGRSWPSLDPVRRP
ncbi:hypothetical protein [Sphingobium lignivorans]|uniref:DUF8021 domain-containing protein n=1 Tax=Sphingobium lignivorans TaxID=2735886 RepID=A0ABR6NHJ0_9SPHN|nr:hypothetical protein [Sphingobium lignivorans]MBB5986735.1 hypothetical protein [Sphingobium lignivorans]